MCHDRDSPNHDYVLETVARRAGSSARVLDFGCGSAAFVGKALRRGLDAWGTDLAVHDMTDHDVRPYVRTIEAGRLPWPDSSFDAVVSNQVFEHMARPDVAHALAEIRRVLRPGGLFLALFPTAAVWFEGHFGIYFLHRLAPWPRLLRAYLLACHRLGFGYQRHGMPARAWASTIAAAWPYDIRHHDAEAIRTLWREAFDAEPVSLAADYVRFRLPRLARLPAPLLAFICEKRAGCVLAVTARGRPQVATASLPRSALARATAPRV